MSKKEQDINQNNIQKIQALSEAWDIQINNKTINGFATKQTLMIEPSQLDIVELNDTRPITNLLWHMSNK
ncbi:MAG: hypothetical protein P8J51_04115 [Dehalococcoidia bacterium]|nr:hypothetical protein [Dehalococcoidia bacterium]